jgi:hypothetical protein
VSTKVKFQVYLEMPSRIERAKPKQGGSAPGYGFYDDISKKAY